MHNGKLFLTNEIILEEVPSTAVSSNASCPKVWSHFKLKKKEVVEAMMATPGWQK